MASENRQSEAFTAEELIDLGQPSNIRISPDGKLVLYTLKPMGKKDDHLVSSIWLGDFGVENSARQLTSGKFNDHSPEFSPDGKSIAFISDRAEAGKSKAIYLISLAGGEAYAVTEAKYEANIDMIAWSPNGQFLAFISPDEETDEKKAKNKAKDDAKVYGEDWRYNHLRLLHVFTRKVSTLFSEPADVNNFSWSPDSTQIILVTQKHPGANWNIAAEEGSSIELVSIISKTTSHLLEYPGWWSGPIVWRGDRVLFVAGTRSNSITTSAALYTLSVKDAANTSKRIAHGDTDCVDTLRPLPNGAALKVLRGHYDSIELADSGKTLISLQQDISDWDVCPAIYNENNPSHLYALITSTASKPSEVYTNSPTDASSSSLIQISSHGALLADRHPTTFHPLTCPSYDSSTTIQGFFTRPTNAPAGPLPTLVHLHGGPYHRTTDSFNTGVRRWDPYLLSTNRYAILSVNYRGSSAAGDAFASAARGAVGTVEYDDVLALVDHAVKAGLADKEKLIVGGWSQGGFLSYLSAVRNGAQKLPNGEDRTWRFKGAVCGAGVTDWDMLIMSSDAPFAEAELGGIAPWLTNKTDTSTRRGSPIWELAGAAKESVPPVLILHGEDDVRVPVTQAWAFQRGCKKFGLPCEMVVYPREGHPIGERAHLVDLLGRLRRFCDACVA